MPTSFGQPPSARFLPWNAVKKPISKTNFGFNPNSDDFSQKNLDRRSQAEALQAQQDDSPPSLADEYAKMSGNRPQRLAYQEAVQSGPEQIQRGKWAKLGAALAAGGSALGGTKAPDAVNMALSAYYEPQRRSDEYHAQKVKGLADLANMEESDMQEKLKVLEYQNKDWYAKRADRRETDDAKRQDAESKAKIDEMHQRMDAANTDQWDDKATGLHWVRKPDGTMRSYKSGLTLEEDAKQKAAVKKAESEAEWATREKEIKAQGDQQARVADIQGKTQRDVASEGTRRSTEAANIKAGAAAKASADRLREKANSMSPGSRMGNILIDMAGEIEGGRLPADATSYLKFDDNGMPSVDRGWANDQESKEKEAAIKGWLSTRIAGGNKGVMTSTPPSMTMPNPSGTTSTGRKYQVTPMPGQMAPSASHKGGR